MTAQCLQPFHSGCNDRGDDFMAAHLYCTITGLLALSEPARAITTNSFLPSENNSCINFDGSFYLDRTVDTEVKTYSMIS